MTNRRAADVRYRVFYNNIIYIMYFNEFVDVNSLRLKPAAAAAYYSIIIHKYYIPIRRIPII